MSDASGSPAANIAARVRPEYRNLSLPQLIQIRLPAAGIVSILHRVSGALMFLVGIPFVLYLFQHSITSEISFEKYKAMFGSWLVKLILLALAWAFIHHMCAGIRFLLLDLHIGITKEQSRSSALAVFGASAALTLIAALKIFGAF